MKNLIVITAMIMTSVCSGNVFHHRDRVYIDSDAFHANEEGDEFYIHTGDNVWLVTTTIHRDGTGMFTFEANIGRNQHAGQKAEYEKKWKCPYCYKYWPIGKACANEDCPSKYKG